MPDHEDDLSAGRHDLYLARLARTREFMRRADMPVLVVHDPVNVFYATGARNMAVWTMRTPARYLLLFAEGPAILYDFFGCEHLARDLPTIDEIRPAMGLCHISSGGDADGAARRFADEMRATVDAVAGPLDTLGVDRLPFQVTDALREQGFRLSHTDQVFCPARSVKMAVEIPYMMEAMRRVEAAAETMQDAIRPGVTETEIWAEFQRPFLSREGHYITTRLLQAGERTFPYFQECREAPVAAGDLVCFDTDACGYEGYAVDFSRTYLCAGAGASAGASDVQRRLFGLAREQLEWNAALIKPGAEYRDIAEHAWPVPDEHQESRYYCVGHGLGVAGEFPNIPHARPGTPYPLTGGIEPGMVICIESYVGAASASQGVKLEQQLLVTETGTELMSTLGFDERLAAPMI